MCGPRDVADVVAVLQEAQAHGIPVVPQGARTSLTGASCATEGAIVLNVEDLGGVDIDPVEGHARVGPGVVTADVKAAAREAGLFYLPDPASSDSCTIGGNVATNAGGLCCINSGVTADYVKSLEVVLAGGERIRTGKRTAKSTAGYDLDRAVRGVRGHLGRRHRGARAAGPKRSIPRSPRWPPSTPWTTPSGRLALRADRHRPSLLEFLDRAFHRGHRGHRRLRLPIGV